MRIDIKRAVYEENDARAKAINERLRGRGIFTVNFLGSPGSGKTSLITRVAERLGGDNIAVIEGDIASDIDTQTLKALGIEAFQIQTGGDCHLNAAMIDEILPKMTLRDGSWLFVENIGNLVCPAEFVIGEDLKVVVSSVAEGSDKPYKYPIVFAKSAACALTKIDLKEAVGFKDGYFREGLSGASPSSAFFPLNALTGEGVDAFVDWLKAARSALLNA